MPLPGLDLAVDSYHVAIDDRIVLSGNFTGGRITQLLSPFGANSARFFTNAIDTKTRGVDATVNYRLALSGAGDVRLHASFNNTRTRIEGAVATPPQLVDFDQVLFDRIERWHVCSSPASVGRNWSRYQITLTTPAPRMSASRVINGSSRSMAAAQISASNGSRLSRVSSAMKICAEVRSYGW